MRRVVFGGTALTMGPMGIVKDAVIEVVDGRIVSVNSHPGFVPGPGAEGIDATNCLILPGLVNGHTHTGMTLLRGIGDDLPLHQWLSDKIFPLERKWGSEEFVRAGTRLAALEMIRSGTTTFNDMYYFEEHAAQVAHEAGLRAVCGQTVIEISQVEDQGNIIAKLEAFIEMVANYPLIKPAIAPHSIYGVGESVWKALVNFARRRDLLVHVHLAETRAEEETCRQDKGRSATRFFEEIGLWECRAIAAHAVELEERDIETLGKYRVGIAHNPESNLKLANRICPVVDLRAAGCPVALGTDGTASNNNLDLLQEADTAAKLQVFRYGVGKLSAEDTVKLLTIEGARALGLDDEIGSLEPGKAGDIICVDTDKAHAQPLHNPYSHLVYSASGGDVKHTIVAGKVLMENYRILSLDEKAILTEAREWGRKIGGN